MIRTTYMPTHALDYVHDAHSYNIIYYNFKKKLSPVSDLFWGTLPNQITPRPLMFSPCITYVTGF